MYDMRKTNKMEEITKRSRKIGRIERKMSDRRIQHRRTSGGSRSCSKGGFIFFKFLWQLPATYTNH